MRLLASRHARHKAPVMVDHPTASSPAATGSPRALARWLFAVAGLVFAMVVVGGITRLTESGLSIVDWEPVTGILPPLDAAGWRAAFEAYQASPEYQQVNRGMTLAEFQNIYFWEYVHRLLGRLIGLAFALPLLWFWTRRMIPANYGWRLTALLALGGLQGAIGWWMVASGLVDRPDVSHIRLAAHLTTALVILGGLVWTALDLLALERDPRARPARLTGFGAAVLAVLLVQVVYGAFVAGMEAGYVASDWPLMQGRFFPAGIDWQGLSTFANDSFLIHFIHRWWAWVAVAALVLLARRIRAHSRPASIAIHSAFGIQILLGIATVMTGIAFSLAVLHQAVGALVVASAVWGVHLLGRKAI